MKDPAVRAVSLTARGLWIDMLCLMWESPKIGHLVHRSGKPVSLDQLARQAGCSREQVAEAVQELEDCGVVSRNRDGILFNRRMERDERARNAMRENGKKGGNPILVNPQVKGAVNQSVNPQVKQESNPKGGASSSSSTSASAEVHPPNARTRESAEAVVPSRDEVRRWGEIDGVPQELCDRFWRHYESVGWRIKGQPITKPRVKLAQWREDEKQNGTTGKRIHKHDRNARIAKTDEYQDIPPSK